MRPVTSLAELLDDLEAEQADLDVLVADLPEENWGRPTPAAGWAVRDQISHLAYFDDMAALAVDDPHRFSKLAEEATARALDGSDPMAEHLGRGREMTGHELLSWWRGARRAFGKAASTLDPEKRVPWFGPPMSPRSFVSARLMETWAHGQDVADALGVTRAPTPRLLHVAHIGVLARPFSYLIRGLEAPVVAVRVELSGPSGEPWSWNEDADANFVRGPALDFCLVVTQRRHVDDTELEIEGPDAHEWIAIAQAFAGPPGPGRPPSSTADVAPRPGD
jgi:uncharacterized protein (TIGR03084 family)